MPKRDKIEVFGSKIQDQCTKKSNSRKMKFLEFHDDGNIFLKMFIQVCQCQLSIGCNNGAQIGSDDRNKFVPLFTGGFSTWAQILNQHVFKTSILEGLPTLSTHSVITSEEPASFFLSLPHSHRHLQQHT